MKRFNLYQLPAILGAIAIFVQSSISNLTPPSLGFSFQDKFYHVIEFLIFGHLLIRAFYNSRYAEHAFQLSIITGLLYAISDEIHQYFVPGRYADVKDVVADFIGILLAMIIYKYFVKYRTNN